MIINLTQHTITEVTTGLSFPPSGRVVRVRTASRLVKLHGQCPVYSYTPEEVIGLPEPQEGTIFIVSALALTHIDRPDVVAPGPVHKDELQRPVGCFGFRQK